MDGQQLNHELRPAGTAAAVSEPRPATSNVRVVAILLALVLGSLLFVALQPRLYRAFCEWTGLYDLDRPDAAPVSSLPGRPLVLELDANSHGSGLQFRPQASRVEVKTGDIVHVVYRVENTLDRTVVGQAIPSYGPQYAGGFVKKLECFCFKPQTFAPHEVRELPVVFLLDPQLPEEVNTLTLSYTFFEVPAGSAKSLAMASVERK